MRLILIMGLFLSFLVPATAKDIMSIEVSGQANGVIEIELLSELAPSHVTQIKTLVSQKQYDGVAFHRVIDGFMAQTGDVKFGNVANKYEPSMVGRGGSQLPDITAEFSNEAFDRGIVGMARSQNPNSANSQFFIMLEDGHFLNGQYTVFGKVVSGMAVVDAIKKGDQENNGMIDSTPDFMKEVIIRLDD
tara:strand:- start:55 stop:624 length:570 start_codon:yes stop_codon:yes gene_type:complete